LFSRSIELFLCELPRNISESNFYLIIFFNKILLELLLFILLNNMSKTCGCFECFNE
jgi:hypothetical protein